MIWEELTAFVCLGSTAPLSAFIASKLRVEDFACMLSVRDFRETPQCVLAVLGSEFFAAIPSYILHCQEDRQNVQCHDLRLSPASHDRTLLCYACYACWLLCEHILVYSLLHPWPGPLPLFPSEVAFCR